MSQNDGPAAAGLPVRCPLAPAAMASLLIAILVAAASAIGLAYRGAVYPTRALQESFLATDVVNLALGVPILLGTLGLAWRRRLVGMEPRAPRIDAESSSA